MEYMSQEGYDKLVAELRQLESVELPQVRDAIAEARDKGDLSENFEYHAAKREQGRLLSRIRFMQRVLENARVLDTEQLSARVTAYRAGTRIKLSVSRDNGISRENIVVTVTLMERAKMPDDE